jgi:hypothetical protein
MSNYYFGSAAGAQAHARVWVVVFATVFVLVEQTGARPGLWCLVFGLNRRVLSFYFLKLIINSFFAGGHGRAELHTCACRRSR